MRHPIRRLASGMALLLILLLANLSWVQVLDADSLRNHPGNTRLLLGQFNRERGPILVEAVPIAASSRGGGSDMFLRSYTNGPAFAAVTGYFSPLYGATGVELAENAVLSGYDDRLFVDRVQQLFAGRQPAGGAVSLTLERAAQLAAYQALLGHRGAAVALDARTGAVRVLVSLPSYDPQELAPNDPVAVRRAYASLSAAVGEPLTNRVLQRTYPIDSVFGLVTAAAAVRTDRFDADTVVQAPARVNVDGIEVRTTDGRPCGTGASLSLAAAAARGCRTALAVIGARLDVEQLRSAARGFGFDSVLGTPLTSVRSSVGASRAALMATGDGVRATPLQLAAIMAAIANDGRVMRPYLVQDLRGPDLSVLSRATPRLLGRPLSAAAAQALGTALRVTDARRDCPACAIPGLEVRATTTITSDGTGVFIGSVGSLAVAVVIEPGGDTEVRAAAARTGAAIFSAVFGLGT